MSAPSEYVKDKRPLGTGYWYDQEHLREDVSKKSGKLVLRCLHCGKIGYPLEEHAERVGDAYYAPNCRVWHVKVAPKVEPKPTTNGLQSRDYQEGSIEALYDYFGAKTGNPIVAMPTGTGKSVVIAEFIRRAYLQFPGTRILVLTHVKELIEQNFKTLLRLWPTAPAGVYSAGLGRREHQQSITFAGIQSIYRSANLFGAIDLVLIDECHLVSPKSETMYGTLISALRESNKYLKVVGFSATPYRLKQGMLTDSGGLFTDVCFDLTSRESFNWLIAQGWLVPPVPKKTINELDISGVRIQGGEFVMEELQARVDQEKVTMAALQETIAQAENRLHWLVFASGIQHAEHIADYLDSNFGIPAVAVHSRMSDDDRDRAIHDFRTGRIRAIVNNNILTTGFDYPDIDCIVMLRPTASPGLWVQMLGRGTRPVYAPGFDLTTVQGRLDAIAAGPKRNCLVLDFAGNTRRLGPINDPVIPRSKGKGNPGIAPVRLCDNCGCYSHASARFCENCGMEFPRAIKIESQASIQDLVAGKIPELKSYPVSRVVYSRHKKEGKPDSMRVDYYIGFRRISEWICLDHGGYAARKARMWWELRCQWGVPPNVAAGFAAINDLRVPTQITVAEKGRHPEICGYTFE